MSFVQAPPYVPKHKTCLPAGRSALSPSFGSITPCWSHHVNFRPSSSLSAQALDPCGHCGIPLRRPRCRHQHSRL